MSLLRRLLRRPVRLLNALVEGETVPPSDRINNSPAICDGGIVFIGHAPQCRVEIAETSRMTAEVYMATNSAVFRMGERSLLGRQGHVTCATEVTIGNDVLIAQQCLITDSDNHSIYFEKRKNDLQEWIENRHDWSVHPNKPVIIEDGAWIGARAIILKGVRIGQRAVVGAGSVVTQDVEADCIYAGNPARFIRRIEQ
jgi:acetyltransferase-like isoleucine patch superfamily enzyme